MLINQIWPSARSKRPWPAGCKASKPCPAPRVPRSSWASYPGWSLVSCQIGEPQVTMVVNDLDDLGLIFHWLIITLPKPSILVGFSIINHPAIGVPPWLRKPPYVFVLCYLSFSPAAGLAGSLWQAGQLFGPTGPEHYARQSDQNMYVIYIYTYIHTYDVFNIYTYIYTCNVCM